LVSTTITAFGQVTQVDALTISGQVHDSSKKIQFLVKGGTNGERYLIVQKFTTANGDKLEADVVLAVDNVSVT
jgi:hypothetical protein